MFYTLHEISYSAGIAKLVAFYALCQQTCDKLGVKLQFSSFGKKLIFGKTWSKTAVFQFWQKIDFWQNWCANIALFERFAFRYDDFENMKLMKLINPGT